MSSLRIFSTRRSDRFFWGGLCILTLMAAALSLGIGSVKLKPGEVLAALTGRDTASIAARIVLYSRLPRTCAAMLAGAALAVSGAIIQTVLDNPLASPSVIGVNSGAGLAVALVCAAAPSAQQYTPLVAFGGALAGVFLVAGLSRRTGASRMTVILAGVAISALFGAGIDTAVTLVPDALGGFSYRGLYGRHHGAAGSGRRADCSQHGRHAVALSADGYPGAGQRHGPESGALCGACPLCSAGSGGSPGGGGSEFLRSDGFCGSDCSPHYETAAGGRKPFADRLLRLRGRFLCSGV